MKPVSLIPTDIDAPEHVYSDPLAAPTVNAIDTVVGTVKSVSPARLNIVAKRSARWARRRAH